MYIETGTRIYPCRNYWPGANATRFELDGPVPEDLGETVALCADDGFEMAAHTVADWLRWEVRGTTLVLTNLPVPEPAPEPEPPVPSAQADMDALLVDHEYRLTILELGV